MRSRKGVVVVSRDERGVDVTVIKSATDRRNATGSASAAAAAVRQI